MLHHLTLCIPQVRIVDEGEEVEDYTDPLLISGGEAPPPWLPLDLVDTPLTIAPQDTGSTVQAQFDLGVEGLITLMFRMLTLATTTTEIMDQCLTSTTSQQRLEGHTHTLRTSGHRDRDIVKITIPFWLCWNYTVASCPYSFVPFFV